LLSTPQKAVLKLKPYDRIKFEMLFVMWKATQGQKWQEILWWLLPQWI